MLKIKVKYRIQDWNLFIKPWIYELEEAEAKKYLKYAYTSLVEWEIETVEELKGSDETKKASKRGAKKEEVIEKIIEEPKIETETENTEVIDLDK